MSDVGNSKRPIIIKRKKVFAAGHHGGAWKVAYADFVTAMMAFFLLMWLLVATNEKQRKAIADYFNPTITINRNSGGGGSFFGGDSPFPEESLPHNGVGASNPRPAKLQTNSDSGTNGPSISGSRTFNSSSQQLQQAQQMLMGGGGESFLLDNAKTHVLTRLTDEGLVIEIFDIPDDPLFIGESAQPAEITLEISKVLARVFKLGTNGVALGGHTRAVPIVALNNETWGLSTARAMAMRQLLEESGLDGTRIQRVTGFATRKPINANPMSYRNNRLEIILLRSDQ